MAINQNSPVSILPKIGPVYSDLLKKLGIFTIKDLILHYPFRYDDYSNIVEAKDLKEGEPVTVIGEVTSISNALTKNRKKLTQVSVNDGSGKVAHAVWFNQFYISQSIKKGDRIAISGKPQFFGNKLVISSPDYEITHQGRELKHTGRLVPVYPETEGLSSKWLRGKIDFLLRQSLIKLDDPIPTELINKNNLTELNKALEYIHFPENQIEATKAFERFSYQEMFETLLDSISKRNEWKKRKVNRILNISKSENVKEKVENLIEKLPFKLTNSQKKSLEEILKDLEGETPMNRLLQGDVGSGKTVIALVACYAGFLNGGSSYIMAPTEILAKQHYETFKKILEPLGVGISLITGSIKEKISDINIGTHALIYDKTVDKNMCLAVIDEQHKFGVEQRAEIAKKINQLNPHVLTMTATPIPRTLALTILGDLELSYLSEKPAGREEVATWVISEEKRIDAYKWLCSKIVESEFEEQAFVVCPLIEESESETLADVKAATKEFELLSQTVLKDLKLGLLHGRMPSKDKEKVITDFRDKKINVLVATPVIEVGIDIPASTIVVIEAAERFGLASLHQIRGRVGRANKKSFCILASTSKNPQAVSRLKLLETYHDGLRLAEEDLKLRGPGEIMGKLQHGKLKFRFADITDIEFVKKVKSDVEQILCEEKTTKESSRPKTKTKGTIASN